MGDDPLFRVTAQLNTLLNENGNMRWQPVPDGVCTAIVSADKDNGTTTFRLYGVHASGALLLEVDLVRKAAIKRVSECFVMGRDIAAGSHWGLNFLNQAAADKIILAFELATDPSRDAEETKSALRVAPAPAAQQPTAQFGAVGVSAEQLGIPSALQQTSQRIGAASPLRENMHVRTASTSSRGESQETEQQVRSGSGSAGTPASMNDDDMSSVAVKSGWLELKKNLSQKNQKLEFGKWATTFKKYWAVLRGPMLSLYRAEDRERDPSALEAALPKHAFSIDRAIAVIDGEAKRDFVFHLSSSDGDTHFLAALSQLDAEDWVRRIHVAAAMAMARFNDRSRAVELLTSRIEEHTALMDSEAKRGKMNDFQVSFYMDEKAKEAINKRVKESEAMMESLALDVYRARYLLSALRQSEPPSAQALMAHVSKQTRQVLGKPSGPLSPVLVHAVVSMRTPARAKPLLERKNSNVVISAAEDSDSNPESEPSEPRAKAQGKANKKLGMETFFLRVKLPDDQKTAIEASPDMKVLEVLETVAAKRKFDACDYFVIVAQKGGKSLEPPLTAAIGAFGTQEIEVCKKVYRRVQVLKSEEPMFGLVIRSGDGGRGIVVARMVLGEAAEQTGLLFAGDEILEINGVNVLTLGVEAVSKLLRDNRRVVFLVRSKQGEEKDNVSDAHTTGDGDKGVGSAGGDIIQALMCRPPPSRTAPIMDADAKRLTIPPPPALPSAAPLLSHAKAKHLSAHVAHCRTASTDSGAPAATAASPVTTAPPTTADADAIVEALLKTVAQLTLQLRNAAASVAVKPPTGGMTKEQMRDNVIGEMMNTERSYVRDLGVLVERFMEPLKQEGCVSESDIPSLFSNIAAIRDFQAKFLVDLEAACAPPAPPKDSGDGGDSDQPAVTSPPTSKDDLPFRIGAAIIAHSESFRLYADYCANHPDALTTLHKHEGNARLRSFLDARNPNREQSMTLESFLIKPVQRLLKYPLLLREMIRYTPEDTPTHKQLNEALAGITAVAGTINEVKRQRDNAERAKELFETVEAWEGPAFDTVGDLLYFGELTKLDTNDSANKMKKLECFLFAKLLVFARNKNAGKKPPGKPVYAYTGSIPIGSILVRDKYDSDDVKSGFEVVDMRAANKGGKAAPVTYLCLARNAEEKIKWISLIKQVVKQSILNKAPAIEEPSQAGGPHENIEDANITGIKASKRWGSTSDLARPGSQVTR
eukprot:Opistho-2@11321